MLSNEAELLFSNPNGSCQAWESLDQFSSLEELQEFMKEHNYLTIKETQGIPHQFFDTLKMPCPEAFEFGQLSEHDREIVYLYSQEAGYSTNRLYLIKEAQDKFCGTWQSETTFAQHTWTEEGVTEGVPFRVYECIDWDKVVKKLKDEDRYTFMDCEEGYAVFCP